MGREITSLHTGAAAVFSCPPSLQGTGVSSYLYKGPSPVPTPRLTQHGDLTGAKAWASASHPSVSQVKASRDLAGTLFWVAICAGLDENGPHRPCM